jgi:hypothetical protein
MIDEFKENQIRHTSPRSVLSQFNPIASLKPETRKRVNKEFILPILEAFFSRNERGGIGNFSALDPDKLVTEIEFTKKDKMESFVKTYIYKEIINEISKQGKKVEFKPKYVITFDRDLANYETDTTKYPYRKIFGNGWDRKKSPMTNIEYGIIRLGEAPILYYILIDLQQLIRFIKTLPEEIEVPETDKISETEEDKRNKLFDTVIFEKQRLLQNLNQTQKAEIEQEIERIKSLKNTSFEGKLGDLQIKLLWNTTDDLDLHIITDFGEISYSNKKVICNNGIYGELDVDKNAGSEIVSSPQENIYFNGIPNGKIKVLVILYKVREYQKVSFDITILDKNGSGYFFEKQTIEGQGNSINVATFEYKNGKLEFIELA